MGVIRKMNHEAIEFEKILLDELEELRKSKYNSDSEINYNYFEGSLETAEYLLKAFRYIFKKDEK